MCPNGCSTQIVENTRTCQIVSRQVLFEFFGPLGPVGNWVTVKRLKKRKKKKRNLNSSLLPDSSNTLASNSMGG